MQCCCGAPTCCWRAVRLGAGLLHVRRRRCHQAGAAQSVQPAGWPGTSRLADQQGRLHEALTTIRVHIKVSACSTARRDGVTWAAVGEPARRDPGSNLIAEKHVVPPCGAIGAQGWQPHPVTPPRLAHAGRAQAACRCRPHQRPMTRALALLALAALASGDHWACGAPGAPRRPAQSGCRVVSPGLIRRHLGKWGLVPRLTGRSRRPCPTPRPPAPPNPPAPLHPRFYARVRSGCRRGRAGLHGQPRPQPQHPRRQALRHAGRPSGWVSGLGFRVEP